MAAGADLMLKGAYTQSRIRQMIFGGAHPAHHHGSDNPGDPRALGAQAGPCSPRARGIRQRNRPGMAPVCTLTGSRRQLMAEKKDKSQQNEGEGNRTAAREYNKAQQGFARSGKVEGRRRKRRRRSRAPRATSCARPNSSASGTSPRRTPRSSSSRRKNGSPDNAPRPALPGRVEGRIMSGSRCRALARPILSCCAKPLRRYITFYENRLENSGDLTGHYLCRPYHEP